MTAVGPIGRQGAAAHWSEGDQFAAQCGTPATRAVVERRWRLFAASVDAWQNGFEARRPLQVLDAGCGDGINLIGLADMLRVRGMPFELAGLDGNALRLERAKALGVAHRLVHASLLAPPCPDERYDLVLCNHVLEHIPEPERAASQLARILRRGGLALIGVPNEGCAMARMRNRLLQRSILKTTDHVNFFTKHSLARMLAGAGLRVETVHAAGLFLPHLRLSNLAMRSVVGRTILDSAGRLCPSQAADLIAVATRSA